MSYREVYEKWCNDPYFDEESREELKALEGNEAEIEDRFYRQLEFGTGGLRGVIGAGTNRMNIYTVRQATQGLANYIISQNGQEKGVAIAHDSRRMSPEFAREAALCLNATESKRICSSPCVRHRSFLLLSVNSAAFPVSSLPQATTRESTTDTKYTGRMAHRLHRRTTKTSSQR